MALVNVVKNSWPATATQAQVTFCLNFQNYILWAAAKAGRQFGLADMGGSGAHGLKAEERFFQDNPKPHRFFRASTGSTIEKLTYQYLVEVVGGNLAGYEEGKLGGTIWTGKIDVEGDSKDIAFALEYVSATPPAFPLSFKSSRPDIRLALGSDTAGHYLEAIFDLTSEAQKDHVLKKGDNWVAKAALPYIAEILWTNDDIMHKS